MSRPFRDGRSLADIASSLDQEEILARIEDAYEIYNNWN